MFTLLVASGLLDVTAAVVVGISPSMAPSAALLAPLTVRSSYMKTGKNHNLNRHRHIEGHCNSIHKGKVRVGFWVGKCDGAKTNADAYTGWITMSRIFIEEVSKAQ